MNVQITVHYDLFGIREPAVLLKEPGQYKISKRLQGLIL
jgi:hypothetical protein